MPESRPRILVIEQDCLVQDLLRDVLEDDGYRALITTSWLDPEDIRQLRPEAIIADPLVDGAHGGWDYLRLLRRQPGIQHLPFIVCTARHELLRDLTAAELSLASSVVLKPFDLDELLDAISSVMVPRSPKATTRTSTSW
jgi:two-component system response regulator VicR